MGIGESPKELKKFSLETMGELVVGKTSCRRVEQLENALDDTKFLTIPRIMKAGVKVGCAKLSLKDIP